MKIFTDACLRLTAWYVLIIMSISLLLSLWVYNQTRNELQMGYNQIIDVRNAFIESVPAGLVQTKLQDSRQRVLVNLVGFNLVVLIVGAGASYFLAKRTLQPIEDSLENQARFTADASHELRTPLATMKTEIEVALRGKQISVRDTRQLLQSNLEEINRLSALTEGLLTLANEKTPVAKPVQLHKVITQATARLKPLALAKNITIRQKSRPFTVSADRQALETIVGILLDNAIKYSPPKTTVTIATYKKAGRVCLEVKDQGFGIKAADLPHIFERFYRADTARSKAGVVGNGLGLSIAQKLAGSIGAHITATSKPGRGSIFTIAF